MGVERIVSIHAPAWGATITDTVLTLSVIQFQSTHPRGVRRNLCKTSWPNRSFNPRTRVGCDSENSGDVLAASCVSIHAPAWGATSRCAAWVLEIDEFQSTHPRGVRRLSSHSDFSASREFQSTHPRGVRPNTIYDNCIYCCFNPRTRVGCDASDWIPRVCVKQVSIHAPAWGATNRGD